MAQGLFASPPMAARHDTAQNRAAHGYSLPPSPPIPTPPDPTRNGPLETTTMECKSHTYGPNAFVFLWQAQC